jgi:asparagine synthase (glutamine-hydrolysing)
MVAALQTNHRYLECGNGEQYDHLFRAVDARDLPCMADVEASMHYFCGKVRDHNQVTLTGECADEIFGGYPWFHSQAAFESPHFPWTPDFKMRKAFLREELVQKLPLETYEMEACKETIRKTPKLSRENDTDSRRREIAYLNLRWFMAVLLERMDRTSMHSGLEARVPFADHRIVEYVWNVPWEMKNHGKITKALLRHSAKDLVPEEILWRRKSPYPKTYDPAYEALLLEKLREVVTDEGAPVRALIDQKKILAIKKGPSDYGKPWYGQLMAGPQMLAYLLQINYWLETYHIRIL